MEETLYDSLKNYNRLGRISFHTPGHKNTYGILPKDLLDADLTELPETDSLYEARGIIDRAEKRVADLFGAERTLFSAGGCTLCIQTMIRLAAPNGGKAVVSRMLHKSAVNAMAMLKVEPIWVMPKNDAKDGLVGRIQPGDIERELQKNKGIKFVYLTSPDYYGIMCDVESIAKICKNYNVPLLVDNAHGTHLHFLGDNLHPIYLGADMTADSAHKTLPVLTGGAFLHIGNKKYIDNAKTAMGLFGSTSPFYPTMASLDLAAKWLKEKGTEEFKSLRGKVEEIKEVARAKGIKQPEGLCDPVRISLDMASIGISGNEAAKYMRKRGVEPEFSDLSYVVLIATPMNTESDFEKLKRIMEKMPVSMPIPQRTGLFTVPNISVPMHEAIFMKSKIVFVRESKGKISAQTVCPCPPGIPILVPGEVVDENAAENLLRYGILEINVLE